MAFEINDDAGVMAGDGYDTTATRQPDGRWTVTGRAGSYTRNQAITAMCVAERLASGRSPDDPFVQGWEAELEKEG